MSGAPSQTWLNGRIYTGPRVVESLRVEQGRVVAAGTRAEILRLGTPGSETIDLHRRSIIPGLIDAHLHLRGSVVARAGVGLSNARDLPELLDLVRSRLESTPEGPLIGGGWDQERLTERRPPTRSELDQISPDRPILLYRVCGHVAVLNSPALTLTGRDGSREVPDGLLREAELSDLVPVLARAFESQPEGLEGFLREASEVGLTTVVPMGVDSEELQVVADTFASRPLPVLVRAYLASPALPEADRLLRTYRTDDIRLIGVKVITDGSFGAHTAWLEEPYEDQPGTGDPWGTEETMAHVLVEANQRGLGTAWHAIGDRALRRVLHVLAGTSAPVTPRIEHASLTPPPLIEELVRLRPNLVVQPGFVASDRWLPTRLGPERARWSYAYRTLLDRGLRLAGSSDSPVEPLDPWIGMQAAVVAREGPTAIERLAPREALALYTHRSGEVLGDEGLGTLEAGAPADLVVLDAPNFEAALALGSTSVRATYRAGRPTFERGVDPVGARRRSR